MTRASTAEPEAPARRRTKLALGAVAVVTVLVLARSLELEPFLRRALAWTESLGALAPAAFVLLYVVATVLFLPGSVLTLGAGALFGVLEGTILVSIAATAGATAAFLIGRHLARDRVARMIAGDRRFRAIDDAVARDGWKVVGLLRLSPIFPFNVLNYAFGLTRVRLRDYVVASWIGMLPGTILYVYLGSIAGDLARAGDRARTPAEWTVYAVGLLATIAVTVFAARLARRALEEKIGS
ncbi:MAG: hypothetical protein QOD06_3096 [Candidatus Binatota bacterium]|jgi:uncharacterized membrane protein YdjX (TVP38/TMEM64 family)|nr:hypothetical protein [Candidatus Binatota bacterium]